MAEIIFRLPSRAVQYGYVEVKGTPEEFGIPSLAEADAIGTLYAVYMARFLVGEQTGASVDVGAPVGASHSEVAERVQAKVDAHEAAVNEIEKGLGGIVIDDEAEDLRTGDEYTKVPGDAPWTEEVDAPKKPWETDGVTAPVVLDASW